MPTDRPFETASPSGAAPSDAATARGPASPLRAGPGTPPRGGDAGGGGNRLGSPAAALAPTRINPSTQEQAQPARAQGIMLLDLATADFIGARAQQQDTTDAKPLKDVPGALLILGDGLGGHESGAEASRIVVDSFVEAAVAGQFDAAATRRQVLRDTLDTANNRIAGGVNPAHGQRSMASTAVAAIVADGVLSWVSVGDSHLYLWRAGKLWKLNQDHSQAGLMIRSGQYQPNDPEVLAAKSVLVSALTGRKLDIVDWPKDAFKIEKGDVVLLASDGLNTLPEQEVEQIVTDLEKAGAKRLSATLLETVKNRRADRQDNTTVAVARVLDVPSQRPKGVSVTDLAALNSITPKTEQVRTEVAATGVVTERVGGETTMRTVPTMTDAVIQPSGPVTEPRYDAPRGSVVTFLKVLAFGSAVGLLALIGIALFRPELSQMISDWWYGKPAVTVPAAAPVLAPGRDAAVPVAPPAAPAARPGNAQTPPAVSPPTPGGSRPGATVTTPPAVDPGPPGSVARPASGEAPGGAGGSSNSLEDPRGAGEPPQSEPRGDRQRGSQGPQLRQPPQEQQTRRPVSPPASATPAPRPNSAPAQSDPLFIAPSGR